MKRFAICILAVLILFQLSACQNKKTSKNNNNTQEFAPSQISASWENGSSRKQIQKKIAKFNSKNEITLFLYTFDTKNLYPDSSLYKKDDYFLEAKVKVEEGKEIKAQEYKGENISATLHTKYSKTKINPQNSTITVEKIGNGVIRGQFNLNDGKIKVIGPFEMDII